MCAFFCYFLYINILTNILSFLYNLLSKKLNFNIIFFLEKRHFIFENLIIFYFELKIFKFIFIILLKFKKKKKKLNFNLKIHFD